MNKKNYLKKVWSNILKKIKLYPLVVETNLTQKIN
jgi:hypothetical protein